MTKEAQSIAAQIRAMSPPERFRLVAELLERRQAETAYSIAQFATTELGSALVIHRGRR